MKKVLGLTILCAAFMCSNAIGQTDTTATDTTTAQPETVQPAQPVPKKNKGDKVYFGGSVILSVGSYTMIGIEPLVGYKLTPKLSVGAKFRYDYIRDSRYQETYETSNYGPSVFARFRFTPSFYGHAEYLNYSYENRIPQDDGSFQSERIWVPYCFVGGGYSKRVGGNTWFNVQVVFDVLQDERSPYSRWEPFYSVGVGVGF